MPMRGRGLWAGARCTRDSPSGAPVPDVAPPYVPVQITVPPMAPMPPRDGRAMRARTEKNTRTRVMRHVTAVATSALVISAGLALTGVGPASAADPSKPNISWSVSTSDRLFAPGGVLSPGAVVLPGETVTYEIHLSNRSANTIPTPNLKVDLSGALDDASSVNGVDLPESARNEGKYGSIAPVSTAMRAASPSSETQEVPEAGPDATFGDDGILTWNSDLPSGKMVVVKVELTVLKEVPKGSVLQFRIRSTKAVDDPNNPYDFIVYANPIGKVLVHASSDPESGSHVKPGSVVSYTFTATNRTGRKLDEGTLAANLSDVLDNASLTQDCRVQGFDASSEVKAASGSEGILTWTGGVPLGAKVAITCPVRVNDDVSSGAVLNSTFSAGEVADPLGDADSPKATTSNAVDVPPSPSPSPSPSSAPSRTFAVSSGSTPSPSATPSPSPVPAPAAPQLAKTGMGATPVVGLVALLAIGALALLTASRRRRGA